MGTPGMSVRSAFAASLILFSGLAARAAAPATGSFRFEPDANEKTAIPERYRLDARTIEYKLALRYELRHSGVNVYNLTFPSPVESPIPENNTVHAEYFVPASASAGEKVPAVIVLDILDGAAVVARGEAMWLAQHGVACLFVHMAHYGPRRPPGSKVKLLSPNIDQTMAAVRQTVLDCRCATSWLASRPEVDSTRLGLVGTSLGSLIGANVAGAEPRLKNVCLLLPCGGLVDALYDHPKAKPYAELLALLGGKNVLKRIIAPADPITYAEQLKTHNLLILAASRDDVLPPSGAKALWEATGKQKIVWYDATHVGAAAFAIPALLAVTEHVKK
jgi:cephalosporin-C deacetylase-like acetyl esterase